MQDLCAPFVPPVVMTSTRRVDNWSGKWLIVLVVLSVGKSLSRHDSRVKYSELEVNVFQSLLKTHTSALLAATLLVGCQSAPHDPLKNPEQAARTRTAMAAEYIRKGDLDTAKQHLERALKSDPRSAEAYNMMGILLQREGSEINLQKAEGYFKKAIGLKDNFAQAHNNYGVYLSQQKRYREALKQFSLAGATLGYEGRAAALENLGRTALLLGEVTQAQQAFESALKAEPNLLVARFELSELLLGQGRVRESAALYDEYVRLLGNNPQGSRSLWLGMRLARLQQKQAQLQQFAQELQQRYPDSDENRRYQQAKNSPGTPWK